jgi:hypothetical protein
MYVRTIDRSVFSRYDVHDLKVLAKSMVENGGQLGSNGPL